jgi:iron complex transport system ATP-binding protein
MPSALELRDVTVWRPVDGRRLVILDDVTWTVGVGERWAVLGPNGAGKTTLLNLLGAVSHPSGGTVEVLGRRLGRANMPALRREIGFLDPALARSFLPALTALEVTLTGADASILYFEDRYTAAQREHAVALLDRLGCAGLRDRPFGRCSQGERKRILLVRALLAGPRLLVLDEPTAGLDLPGRETFLAGLDALDRSHPELTTVLVTHHLEELPRTTTHALLLRAGRIVAAGRAVDALRSENVSACFGLPVAVTGEAGRWSARAAT